GAGLAERAFVLREDVAHVRCRAVSVVRERFDEERNAARAVALVRDVLVRLAVGGGAGTACDRALDVVLRHRVVAGLLDRGREGRVGVGIRSAFTRRDDDRARELGKELATLRVRRALLVFDARPLAMPR